MQADRASVTGFAVFFVTSCCLKYQTVCGPWAKTEELKALIRDWSLINNE